MFIIYNSFVDLAVNDSVTILLILIFWPISIWFRITDVNAAPILYMIGQITYTNSIYLLVLVSMDRYFMLCHQQRAMKFCTTKLIKMYIGCIYIFSFISNIPRIFEHHWDSSTVLKTDFGCSYAFQTVYIIGITMVIRLIIPVTLLAFSNIQLLRKVLNILRKDEHNLWGILLLGTILLFSYK